MGFETIRTERAESTFSITIDREEKPNPISGETLDELDEALTTIEEESPAVVTVTGSGGTFATGADLEELDDWWAEQRWDRMMEFVRHGQQVVNRIDELPVPTIAAIDGYALGGGLELALACDLRFATDGSQVGFPEIDLGMLPAWGGTQRLPGLVGASVAKDMLLTGRRLDAEEAAAIGLVDRVVEDGELLEFAEDYADTLAEKPPVTVGYVLEAVRASREAPSDGGFAVELQNDMLSIFTDEAQRRTAAFLAGD